MWKPCVGFDNYEVSDCGEVRSLWKEKPLVLRKFYTKVYGYPFVCLYQGNDNGKKKYSTQLVHRLVAKSFLKELPQTEVNHKNGNKKDARVENLEWISHKENSLHRHRVLGLSCGNKHYKTLLSDEAAARAREMFAAGMGCPEIAKILGVNRHCIGYALRNRYIAGSKPVPRRNRLPTYLSEEQISEAKTLRNSGLSYAKIGARFDVAGSYIWNLCR